MSVAQAAALDASLLELIRVTSTVLPDDVVRVIDEAKKVEEEGSNARLRP